MKDKKYLVMCNTIYELDETLDTKESCYALTIFPFDRPVRELYIPKEVVGEGEIYKTKKEALQQVKYTEKKFRANLSKIIDAYCTANNVELDSIRVRFSVDLKGFNYVRALDIETCTR